MRSFSSDGIKTAQHSQSAPPKAPQQQQRQHFLPSPLAAHATRHNTPHSTSGDDVTPASSDCNAESSHVINSMAQIPTAGTNSKRSHMTESARRISAEDSAVALSNSLSAANSVPMTLVDALAPAEGTALPPLLAPTDTPDDKAPDAGPGKSIVRRNVYISGLPSYMQSNEFRDLCLRFGAVEALKLCVEGPSNPTKGYGFVLYYGEASAAACIAGLCGSYLNGRCLQARLANTHASPHCVGDLPPSALHPSLGRVRVGRRERRRFEAQQLAAAAAPAAVPISAEPQVRPPVQHTRTVAAPVLHAPSSVPNTFSMGVNTVPPGVCCACAGNSQPWGGGSGGAEGPAMMVMHTQPYPPSPSPTVMYVAQPPYMTSGPPLQVYGGGGGAVPGVPRSPQTHMLPPLMMSAPAPGGVQYYSLLPPQGTYPM